MDRTVPQDQPLVLVVDDENINRIVLCRALQSKGYQVLEAENAERCLDLFQRYQPDIVLLDAIMPKMDGFDCCSKLKRLPGGEETPVLMVTGLDEKDYIDRAFEVGAIDFVTKPIQLTVLIQRIRRLLEAAKAEKALRKSEKQYRSLVTNLEEIIFQTSETGQFIFVNPAWQTVTGYSLEESVGRAFSEFLYLPDQARYQVQMDKLLRGQIQKTHYQIRYRSKQGNIGLMEVHSYPLVTETEQIVGTSGRISDITERKQQEQYQQIAYCVTRVLSKSLSSQETIRRVLQAICGILGWSFGRVIAWHLV
jgi:sigma-B regulation protein RsbU (phosphoserine phosphatase)